MSFCKDCGDFTLSNGHKCRQFVIIDEDGEKFQQYGRDVEDAATKFVREYDVDRDYSLVDGEADFIVKDVESGTSQSIRITGEQVIEYNIEEL